MVDAMLSFGTLSPAEQAGWIAGIVIYLCALILLHLWAQGR